MWNGYGWNIKDQDAPIDGKIYGRRNATWAEVISDVTKAYVDTEVAKQVAVSGDVMTGRLGLSPAGLVIADKEYINTRVDSGFFQHSLGTTAKGWPTNNGWHHLISCTHSNDSNYYALQIASPFATANGYIYWRTTDNNGATGWKHFWDSGNLNPASYMPLSGGTITGTFGVSANLAGWVATFVNAADSSGIYTRGGGYAGIGVGVLRYDGAVWMHELRNDGTAVHSGNVHAPNFYGTLQGSCTGSSSSCTGNAASANYASSAGSAGSAGGLYGTPNITISWMEGPECIDMKTTGAPADFDCRFHLQWPNLNISGGSGFDAFKVHCRFEAVNGAYANGYRFKSGRNGGYTDAWYNTGWPSGGSIEAWVDASSWGWINTSCDYRFKKDVRPLASMWDKVKSLRPIRYSLKDWSPPVAEENQKKLGKPMIVADDEERWGFFAHELQETLTNTAASGKKDSDHEVQGPNNISIIAALTKALQEAMSRIEQLEERI